ncbi:uncharacterized protein LOC122498857 [Leptopilina heterotoma]|uniref:uncharacterized protein LOC122498857 n=1 Tax=Leptopilina heterotoma TaxID=63436 RepID=UPI001CAA2D48|nr:uncharacterized protein LOC122498857 [Leptopilina heterotoma]
MTRIGIFFLLISWTYVENCYLSDSELTELENAFIEAEDYTTRIVSNEDAIICVGATRAGKSTLINYLMGNELKGFKNSKYAEYKIIKANSESIGPEIGQGPTSKTTIPTKWTSNKLSGFSIYDAPGFDDNRGPVQDITNSFYLYLLMRKVKSLKYVLVIDFNDIVRNNIRPLLKFLYDFENIFRDKFAFFILSISIIFSKVPYELDGAKVDIEMIKYLLKEKAVVIENLSSTNVNNFLDYILNNSSHLALFRKAKSNKIKSSDIDFNIFSAIRNTKSVNSSVLQNITPTASIESYLCLYHAKNKWISILEFLKLQKSLLTTCIDMLSKWEKSVMNSNGSSNNNVKEIHKLYEIRNLLNNSIKNEADVYKIIESIGKINDKIKNKIQESNLLRKIKIFYFVSRLVKSNDMQEFQSSFEDLRFSLLTAIEKGIQKVANLRKNRPIRNDLSVGDKVKSNFFLLLGMIIMFLILYKS